MKSQLPLPPDGGVFFSLFAGGGGVGGTPLVDDLVRLLVSVSAAPLSSLCPKPCNENILVHSDISCTGH
jgi:hypothetical protein